MENEFMKRGYLLPEGCKDLIDILKPKPSQAPERPSPQGPAGSAPLPTIIGEIHVPEGTTVTQLAALQKTKPYRIVADLMELGVFASVKDCPSLEIMSRVTRKYGFVAKRSA
jgi:hypothetical protein